MWSSFVFVLLSPFLVALACYNFFASCFSSFFFFFALVCACLKMKSLDYMCDAALSQVKFLSQFADVHTFIGFFIQFFFLHIPSLPTFAYPFFPFPTSHNISALIDEILARVWCSFVYFPVVLEKGLSLLLSEFIFFVLILVLCDGRRWTLIIMSNSALPPGGAGVSFSKNIL